MVVMSVRLRRRRAFGDVLKAKALSAEQGLSESIVTERVRSLDELSGRERIGKPSVSVRAFSSRVSL